MALVRLMDAQTAPLLVRHLYEDGRDPGPIASVLAQVPELCESALPFLGDALAPSSVSLRHKEIAILRTSANLRCRYCIEAHTVVAADSGLELEEVAALRHEADAYEVFTDLVDLALLRWVDALSTQTGPVAPEISLEALTRLGEHRLVDITVTVGATMLLNRLSTGLQLPTSDATITRLAELGFERRQPAGTPIHVVEGTA